MILVFFILLLIILSVLLIVLSTISIRIEKLKISNYNPINKLEYDYITYFELYFLNKIKILSVKIDKDKIKKIDLKQKLQNMDLKNIQKDLITKEEIKEIIKKLKIEIPTLNLKLKIGTENVIVTSGIIALVSSLLGITLARVIKQYDKTKYNYQIYPVYENKNLINLNLNCIIKVKIVHIIYIIYVLVKKRRVNKYERTSNRRTYDYSYE